MNAKSPLSKLIRENRGFIIFMLLMFCFRSAVADWSHVPTGSMLPTIVEGDRIFVDKTAYDIRIPFTHVSLLRTAEPARGDIVIFDSKVADKRLVKRLVGLPGDVLEMRDNRLFINGRSVSYDALDNGAALRGYGEHKENLATQPYKVRVHNQGSALANFSAIRVPQGHYFMLGDNRDNSADSRVIGVVPRDEIVGKTSYVVMSLNYDNYYLPRKNRFFERL